MARTVAFLNKKGGVGKTSTVHHLGGTLARRGQRVLLVDADPQASLSQGLLGAEAAEDLESLRSFDARRVVAAIESQLTHEPTRETRNRKQLRPNELAEWELRVDVFRVSYDVADEVVKVVAIALKEGNDLFVHGQRYEL